MRTLEECLGLELDNMCLATTDGHYAEAAAVHSKLAQLFQEMTNGHPITDTATLSMLIQYRITMEDSTAD